MAVPGLPGHMLQGPECRTAARLPAGNKRLKFYENRAVRLLAALMALVSVAMVSYTLLKRNGPRLTLFMPRACNVSRPGRLGIHITLMGSFVWLTAACMSAGSLIKGRKMPSAPAASYKDS